MIGNPNNAKLTQSGKLDSLFYLAGFVRDIHDHYHTRQDCWQQIGGYNDLYDDVFHIATDMYKDKFDFTYENEDYIFWAWKGNYLNLGAGAELGIYRRLKIFGKKTEHWLVDTDLAMPMTMKLVYRGQDILNYRPKEKQWWVTSFVPNIQNAKASNIVANFTVDFSTRARDRGMYIEFNNKYKDYHSWNFNRGNYKATLTI